MVLKIRLARFGKRNNPFYNIVVAQARTARNSKPLEVLGPCSLFLLLPHNPTHSKDPPQHIPPTHHKSSKSHLTNAALKPGTYDPIPKPPPSGEGKAIKDIKLDTSRAKYWLGVGAQPSEPAWRLLSMVSCFFPPFDLGFVES